MTLREKLLEKPASVPVIFLYLAKLYRVQLCDKVDKKRRRDGLALALNKIITHEKS